MSVSWWRREIAGCERVSADICIVGGGITGLVAADECARRGRSVVLLERHTLGWGASTRNAGYLMRGTADNYAAASDQLGRERARAVWRDSEANLAALIDRFGIDRLPSFERKPSSLVAMTDEETADLRRAAAMLAEDGFEASLRSSGNDTLWRTLRPTVALENPHDAAINPAAMIRRIAECVRGHASITILEQAEVFGIEGRGDRVRVRTDRAEVDAGRVLVCTNAYAGELLPGLAAAIEPNRGQMLAFRCPGARLDASYYLDRGSEYIRQAADGTFVVGGMRKRFATQERTSEPLPTGPVQRELELFAERVLGGAVEVIARWAGTMGFSRDGLPVTVGIEIEGLDSGRAVFCGGFTGHGMSLAAVTAARAAGILLDGDRAG